MQKRGESLLVLSLFVPSPDPGSGSRKRGIIGLSTHSRPEEPRPKDTRKYTMEALIKKLQEEISALEIELRIELPREILKARAHGDLSENAEYHAAKERQAWVNARLNQLQGRLRELSMVDMSSIPHDRVGLGSVVEVLDIDKDEKLRYTMVTSEDVDVARGMISTTSPIGRGLLGKKVGDTVKIQVPGGTREMEIVELITIHQVNGKK